MKVRITHVGTATVILEIGALRLLTDPTFDPAGTQYSWALFGANSTKLEQPAVPLDEIGRFDAALVTHAQHDDNLDPRGRTALERARRVITTRPSARRLGGIAEGLRAWETTELVADDGMRMRITATPARHGPPLSLPFVGKVIGFVLEWEGHALYISGDTVVFGGLAEVARRFAIDLALLHIGQAKLPVLGPFRLTMDAAGATRVAAMLGEKTRIVPLHYDGWSHFSQSKADAIAQLSVLGDRVRWLVKGKPTELEL